MGIETTNNAADATIAASFVECTGDVVQERGQVRTQVGLLPCVREQILTDLGRTE